MTTELKKWGGLTAVLGLSLALLLPSLSLANTRTATSGEILILSDEINGNSVEVERAEGAGGGGDCGSGGDSSGTDSSNSSTSTSSDSGGGGGSNNTSNNCSNNSSTDT